MAYQHTALALARQDGKCLLVKHHGKDDLSWWLPGGVVEPGEGLVAALDAPLPDLTAIGEQDAESRQQAPVWQATFWSGPTFDTFTPATVFGASLVALRQSASTWLQEHHPRCFSNGPFSAWKDPNARLFLARYSASPLIRTRDHAPLPLRQEAADRLSAESKPPAAATKTHRRSRRKQRSTNDPDAPTSDLPTPPSLDHHEEEPDPQEERPAAASPASPSPSSSSSSEHQKEDTPEYWLQETFTEEQRCFRSFEHQEDAIACFVGQDLLPEQAKGSDAAEPPAFTPLQELWLPPSEGMSLQQIRTVKVLSEEASVNHLLRRGGWQVLAIKGALAPVRNRGPIHFVLGHPEPDAV